MSESLSANTPMFRQYNSQKEKNKDAILFFRMGDFYEMFDSDALEVSKLLNLTLTQRQGVPMCGVPYHAAESYIAKLINLGRKIAVCEQMETPQESKGLVKREVVDIYTPGTVIDSKYIDEQNNNYLAALVGNANQISYAFIDLSTSEFRVTMLSEKSIIDDFRREFAKTAPRELIIQESLLQDERFTFLIDEDIILECLPDWESEPRQAKNRLENHFGTINLKAFGFMDDDIRICAAGAILFYLEYNRKKSLQHIQTIVTYDDEETLKLDFSTIRNLELVRNLHDGSVKYTLFDTLNHTKTAMGARALRKRILEPWRDIELIRRSHLKVNLLYHNQSELHTLRQLLSLILDLERLVAKTAMDRASAKDLVSIYKSIQSAGKLWNVTGKEIIDAPSATELFICLEELAVLLSSALLEEPSVLLNEGKIFREGWDEYLDKQKLIQADGQKLLESYVNEERVATGIRNLKLKYNRILGYFIEIPMNQSQAVPERFKRRQSLAQFERYSSKQLDELAEEIASAEDKVISREKELFINLKNRVKDRIKEILEVARIIQQVDIIQSFAHCAIEYGYSRPEINEKAITEIKAGRHPVIEHHQPVGTFVPNDINLSKDTFFALITGPNMAGKSTILRQVALITIMTQIGSFIPCESSNIGIADQIFCRVGASDNLARGESTFLVEMNETAYILRNATSQSLVIMDEVGRGTGTSDGLAIAQAVCSYLTEQKTCRTLFATHYRELTRIKYPGLINLSMYVDDTGGHINFSRQLVQGPAKASYGIHVAELAGIPQQVIQKAKKILSYMETEIGSENINSENISGHEYKMLFDPIELIIQDLESVDTNSISPTKALNILKKWQKELKLRFK